MKRLGVSTESRLVWIAVSLCGHLAIGGMAVTSTIEEYSSIRVRVLGASGMRL